MGSENFLISRSPIPPFVQSICKSVVLSPIYIELLVAPSPFHNVAPGRTSQVIRGSSRRGE